MNEKYKVKIANAQNEDAKMQVFSEIIIENTLKKHKIEYVKDKKVNGNKDVDFQVNYDNWIYNIEVKTPAFMRRLNPDMLYYYVDYRIDNFDHNLFKTDIAPDLFNNTSDKNIYKGYYILTREEYRLEEYLKLMKDKINKSDNTTNVLFIPLYDSQHLCEYFKLLFDTNSLINSILQNKEYEDIHMIILGCFGKKIKDSLYNEELCFDETDCLVYENMYSNQYHKDEYVAKHNKLLEIFPNFTLLFNSENEKYRDDVLSSQRLFPIHLIEYLKNKQVANFKEDNIERYNGSSFICSIKSMFLENSNIRYVFIRDA